MELWDVTETARQTNTSVTFCRKKVARREIDVIKVEGWSGWMQMLCGHTWPLGPDRRRRGTQMEAGKARERQAPRSPPDSELHAAHTIPDFTYYPFIIRLLKGWRTNGT